MYKTLYPLKDTTLYSQFANQNTGVDQILELSKQVIASPSLEGDDTVYYDQTYNSRILIAFDLTSVSQSIVSGKIGSNAEYFLNLRATEANNLSISYGVFAYPVSASWNSGTGYYNNSPKVTNGVSWRYRDSKLEGTLWATESYNANSTGSFGSIPHGSTWYTSSFASQSFNYDEPDIRMNVTEIVRLWLSGSIQNNGFVIKLSDSLEQDSSVFGSIKFFSMDTHTIYIPRLEIYWDDTDLSGIGSISEIGSDDFVFHAKNLRNSYSDVEQPKIRFHVRPRFPTLAYTTSSVLLDNYRIPTSSYFQIQDVVTDEVIIPYHVSGTKVHCDSTSNYIKLDCNSLLSERYYKLVIRCEFDGGDTIRMVDENHVFKIFRT